MVILPSSIMVRAVLASVFAGSLCGLVGVHVTRMKLNTIAFSTAHAALAGAALGVLLEMDPSLIGMVLALATVAFLGPLGDLLGIPFDLVSMVLFSTYTAAAFIFLSISPGGVLSAQAVSSVLWGSALTATSGYVMFLFLMLIFVLIYLLAFRPQLLAVLYDSRLAEAEGINVRAYKYSLMFVTGMTVAFVLKLVGGFLVFALLFIPASAAILASENIRHIISLSAIFGGASALAGLFLSLALDLPAGACIVLMAVAFLTAVAVYSHSRGRLRRV